MTKEFKSPCEVCGSDLTLKGLDKKERRWIALNRYAIGFGDGRLMVESLSEDGEYEWRMCPGGPDNGDPSEEFASATLLCWPTCATLYIEARMVESSVGLRMYDEKKEMYDEKKDKKNKKKGEQ